MLNACGADEPEGWSRPDGGWDGAHCTWIDPIWRAQFGGSDDLVASWGQLAGAQGRR